MSERGQTPSGHWAPRLTAARDAHGLRARCEGAVAWRERRLQRVGHSAFPCQSTTSRLDHTAHAIVTGRNHTSAQTAEAVALVARNLSDRAGTRDGDSRRNGNALFGETDCRQTNRQHAGAVVSARGHLGRCGACGTLVVLLTTSPYEGLVDVQEYWRT